MGLEYVAGLVADSYNNIKTIDSVHHEVHQGDMYSVNVSTTATAGSTVLFYIQTPNTTVQTHFVAQINSSIATITSYFANGTVTSSSQISAVKTIYNMNLTSTKVSGVSLVGTIATSSGLSTYGGTVYERYQAQMPAYIGAIMTGAAYTEWVLNYNTGYVVGVTCPTTAAVQINVKMYEA